MKVETLEQALDKPCICTDGDERKLTQIEEKFLHYSVRISETVWMNLGRTYRSQAEPLFIGGILPG